MKEKVETRNELESYAYSLKNQVNDKEKLGAKISDEDKEKIEEAVNEKIAWLEENQEADGEEFKTQKKELEEIVQPIIAKLYQQGGGPPPGGEEPDDDVDKDELQADAVLIPHLTCLRLLFTTYPFHLEAIMK